MKHISPTSLLRKLTIFTSDYRAWLALGLLRRIADVYRAAAARYRGIQSSAIRLVSSCGTRNIAEVGQEWLFDVAQRRQRCLPLEKELDGEYFRHD